MRFPLVLSLFGASLAAAQPGVHQHGHALLGIAEEAGEVVVELETPAANLLGFEHAPATAEEQAALAEVLRTLADHRNVVALLGQRGELVCSQVESALDSALLSEGQAHDEHHDHDHAGSTAHDHDEDEHADFHARYVLDCPDTALTGVQGRLLENFPAVLEVELQWVLEAGQGGAVLTPARPQWRF